MTCLSSYSDRASLKHGPPPAPDPALHPSPAASRSYWCRSAPTADRFGVMFIDLHVGWICRWRGLTRCDLGRVPRRRMVATSGWAGRAAMQQSRWAALRALTPRTQTHRRQLTDTPLRRADHCVRHAGTPLNRKIKKKIKKKNRCTQINVKHSHTLSYIRCKGVSAAVLQAETDGALTWLCMSVNRCKFCSTHFHKCTHAHKDVWRYTYRHIHRKEVTLCERTEHESYSLMIFKCKWSEHSVKH